MRILVVEDENSIRTALARGLSQYGHRIETASCLAEARTLAKRRAPEILLSDLKLPDGNGLDLAEELCVPFMLMTGYGTFDDAVRAMRLGCFDFFTKPVSIKELSRAIDHLAGRRAGGPLVVDGQMGSPIRLTQPHGTAFTTNSVQITAVTWSDLIQANAAFAQVRPLMPSLTHRQVAAELMQAASSGRLVVNLHQDLWSACLEATVDWGRCDVRRHMLEDLCRRCLWTGAGALVEAATGDVTTTPPGSTCWSGELLWPQRLDDGEVIDLSGVIAVGTWIHQWFTEHPGRGVTRASPAVRRQLLRAGVPVVWVDPMAPANSTGVGPGERAALLGEP